MSTRYGAGSIKEVAPGKWRLRVFLGTDPVTGKPRQRERTFYGIEKAANKELARLVTEAESGKVDPTTATLEQLLDEWISHIEPTRRPSTMVNVRRKIDGRVRPTVGALQLSRLSAHDLDRFYRSLLDAGLSTTTVRQYHAILSAALSQAVKWDWIERNPALNASPPSVRPPSTKVPTVDQLNDLWRRAAATDEVLATAIALASLTGARRGELCALRWSDVDLAAGRLHIRRSLSVVDAVHHIGPTKTHQERRVSLDETAVDVLRRHWSEQRDLSNRAGSPLVPDPYVLSYNANAGRPVSPDTITHRFADLADGLCRFHDLRHFSVTTLIAAGVDVRTVAARHGHASATMTLDRYAHALPEPDRAAAGILGRTLQDSSDSSAPSSPPPP